MSVHCTEIPFKYHQRALLGGVLIIVNKITFPPSNIQLYLSNISKLSKEQQTTANATFIFRISRERETSVGGRRCEQEQCCLASYKPGVCSYDSDQEV